MNFECSDCPIEPAEQTKKTKVICEYDDCSKIFKSKKSLKDHSRIHNGDRPYSCNFTPCDKTFTQFSSFQKHQRVHSGEKPYICQSCNQSFAQVSNLRRHERSHRGEKPHVCDICSKSFTTTSNLKQHQQTHLDLGTRSKFECFDCGKAYNYHNSLKKHSKAHQNGSQAIKEDHSQAKDESESDRAPFSPLEEYIESTSPQKERAQSPKFENNERRALLESFADEVVDNNNNHINEYSFEAYKFTPEKEAHQHQHPHPHPHPNEHVNHSSKDCLRVLHQGHVDYLENGNLQHVKEDGHVEEHYLEVSEQNPTACKPLKEITHVSRLMSLFSQYEELIRKKQLNLTLDMITSSCNIFTCSKLQYDETKSNNYNSALILPDQAYLSQVSGYKRDSEQVSSVNGCPCIPLGPSETSLKTEIPPKENVIKRTESVTASYQEPKEKTDPCLCKETLFLKHVHSENCGHPRIIHQDHVDYIVEGHLHHVHGNHCDDHGLLRVVE